jgi:hypothetical protein
MPSSHLLARSLVTYSNQRYADRILPVGTLRRRPGLETSAVRWFRHVVARLSAVLSGP